MVCVKKVLKILDREAYNNSSFLASKFTSAGTAAQPLIETVTLTPDCCNCNTTGC